MAGGPIPTRVISPDGRFEAYIKLQGQESEVYQAQSMPEKKLSRAWVVSDTGMTFSVHLDCKPLTIHETLASDGYTYDEFKCNYVVDSKLQGGSVTDFRKGYPNIVSHGVYVSPTKLAPFFFSPLTLTSAEDTQRLNTKTTLLLGIIKLEVRRVRNFEVNNKTFATATGIGEINEKEKKAKLANIAGFGASIPAQPIRWVQCAVHPQDVKEPFYTFELQYRTSDVLKAMGVAENPNKPKQELDQKPLQHDIIDLEASDDEQDSDDDEEEKINEATAHQQELEKKMEAYEESILRWAFLALGRQLRAEMEAAKKVQPEAGPSTAKVNVKKRKVSDSDEQEQDDKTLVAEAIEKDMRKALKRAKAVDGGIVDLSED